MTEQLSFNNFGFIGFGLIGGSIAHALKEIYPSSNIIAYNYYKIKTHKKLEEQNKMVSLIISAHH